MKIKILTAVAALAFGLAAARKITTAQANLTSAAKTRSSAALNPGYDRLQALIDGHMSSEAALAAAERKAVVLVRADLWQNEEQMRAAVAKIRRDYRGRTETLMALHASEKSALDEKAL